MRENTSAGMKEVTKKVLVFKSLLTRIFSPPPPKKKKEILKIRDPIIVTVSVTVLEMQPIADK